MYTTKYDVTQGCVQYGDLFLNLIESKRTKKNIKIKAFF